MDEIGRDGEGQFVDREDRPIELMFKLYPWEWMLREEFGASLPGAATQLVEPPWKAILSNKGILPLLWSMFPRHPNLLPACFEDDPRAAELGDILRAKAALFARGRQHFDRGRTAVSQIPDEGPYGAEGFIRQASRRLAAFDGNHAVLGSWIAARRAMRAVGARGCNPDHQKYLALSAARDPRLGAAEAASRRRHHPCHHFPKR